MPRHAFPELLIPGVLRRTDPAGAPVPLVLDSPHSGLAYPADFRPAIPMAQCERVADWHVEALFGAAPAHGATSIEPLFCRAAFDATPKIATASCRENGCSCFW